MSYIHPSLRCFDVTFVLQFRLYLEENNFDTSQMGIRDTESTIDYDEKNDVKVTA